jgi:hypothetical protein
LLAAVALLATGPAPGAGGGCNEDAEPIAGGAYCWQRGQFLVVRDAERQARAGNPLSEEQVQQCLGEVRSSCERIGPTDPNVPPANPQTFDWPANCLPPPSKRQADRCLEELSKVSNVETPVSEIGACQLCPTPPQEVNCREMLEDMQ